jgi:hypothetical protein
MGNDDATLVVMLNRCAEQARGKELTLGEMLDSLGMATYSFIAIVLTVPFLQPISLGPLSTVGGLTFAALGWQLYRGYPTPVLPEAIRRIVLDQKTWKILITVCVKLTTWCRKFSRPRFTSWVSGERGRRTGGLTMIIAGLLMAIPFFGLPFNNLLPALAILFVCIGELEQDGLMVFISFGWLVVTVLYFTIIFVAAWSLGEWAMGFWRG